MTCDDHVLARLRDDYRDWDIAQAHGQWLATRDRVLTEVEMSHGLRHVLTTDTAGQLRDALAAQHTIEMSAPREPA